MTLGGRLKIRNFGPIKEGYDEDEGYMTFPPFTMICGPQGAGKSCVAKLYSIFTWIEKALVRGDFSESYVTQYHRFLGHCSYQGIKNYFNGDTFLHYVGKAYAMRYEGGRLTVEGVGGGEYVRPQIAYIPAERNLMSVANNAYRIRGVAGSLSTMMETYFEACGSMAGEMALPFGGVSMRFDKSNRIAWIKGEGYEVRLSEASSGLQSAVPMLVVVGYLSGRLSKGAPTGMSGASVRDKDKIRQRIERILADNTIGDETRAMLVKRAGDTANKRMVCIVEEPEQNLYPTSQTGVLYKLMEYALAADGQLLITTHSPYLINSLSLAVKAYNVGRNANEEKRSRIGRIVPQGAWIDGGRTMVMQIDKGAIRQLPKYDGMPSDDNYLNRLLAISNDNFGELLEIEEDER